MAECETAAVVGATADGLMVQRYSGRPRRAGRAARREWDGYYGAAKSVASQASKLDRRDNGTTPFDCPVNISRKRRTFGTVSGYLKKLQPAADPTLGKLSRILDTHGAFPPGPPRGCHL
jgi:hypothetical protein